MAKKLQPTEEIIKMRKGNQFRVMGITYEFDRLYRDHFTCKDLRTRTLQRAPFNSKIEFISITSRMLENLGFKTVIINPENKSYYYTHESGFRIFRLGDKFCTDHETSIFFEYFHELQNIMNDNNL